MSKNRSEVVEQRLADYGIEAVMATIPLSDIDATASAQLQNRGGVKIDADNVLQMAVHLDIAPDRVLPRMVVARYRGKLATVDGNHRGLAYDMAGRTEADVYLIKDDLAPEVVEQLAFEANAANGRSLSPEERLQLALKWAELNGDLKLAASRFGFKYDTLQTKKRAAAGSAKARRAAGVKTSLPDMKAEALNRLDEDQIKTIGRDLIENADARHVEDAVKNIVAVPAAEQALQVQQEVGRLAQVVKAKKTPVGKARAKATGPTIKQATAQLNKIVAQVKANPSWRVDAALVAAVNTLVQEVDRGRAAHDSAA